MVVSHKKSGSHSGVSRRRVDASRTSVFEFLALCSPVYGTPRVLCRRRNIRVVVGTVLIRAPRNLPHCPFAFASITLGNVLKFQLEDLHTSLILEHCLLPN